MPDVERLPNVGDALGLAGEEIDETPLIAGWSIPEPRGRWTVGHEASIAWSVRGQEQDVTPVVDGQAVLHKSAPVQWIELWANDRRIANWRFRMGAPSPLPVSIVLPHALIRNRDVLMLTFLIRRPVSPAEIGISLDTRTLGLHLQSITITSGHSGIRDL